MKTKVLIVDDEPIIGNLLEGGLTEAGFEAEYLDSSTKALENIRRVRPDIIISDIAMPHMDGYELRRRLRQDPETAGIPFVFLSARTDTPEQLEGLRMGADDYVYKPFKIENLINRLESVIERSAKARAFHSQAEFSADSDQMSLNDVMQIVGSNRKTGELVFNSSKNGKIGRAFFKKGRLVNAQMGLLEGEEAFYALMGEDEGLFEFHSRKTDAPEQIKTDNMSLLLNGNRMADEVRGLYRQLPDLDIFLEIKSREIPPDIEETGGRNNIENILSMIDNHRTVRDIINCKLMSPLRSGSLLAGLFNAGSVAIQKQGSSPSPSSGRTDALKSQSVQKAVSPKILSPKADFSSDLSHHTAPMIDQGFLKMLKGFERGALTGILEIRNRPEKAAIYFEEGRIVNAYHGNVVAKKALFRIFWEKGGTLKFKVQPLTVARTINGRLSSLIEEGNKEIENLQRLKRTTFNNVVTLNTHMLEKTTKIKGRPGLEHILALVKENSTIKDIIDASQMTDFQTYRHLFYMAKMGLLMVEAGNVPKIQIITDSTADLPPDFIGKRNIVLVPLSVSQDQKVWFHTMNISSGDICQAQKCPGTPLSSASPSVNDFHHLFWKIAPDKDILAIFLSRKISKIYDNAVAAKEKNYTEYLRQRQQKSPEDRNCHIEIIDSQMLSLGMGLLVAEASDKVEAGWSADRVRDHIIKLIPKVRIFFVVDILGNLKQGGQISKIRSMLGHLLGMRPIVGVWNGEVTTIDQVRGGNNARQRVLEWIQWSMDEPGAPIKLGIMHADAPRWALDMKKLLKSKLNCQHIMMSHVGPSAGSYCGPGTVAVAYFPLTDEEIRG
ncbi:DegV family protein [Desulfonema magnum]|nr:DegV family protein [Desulfonema magnum]